MEENFLVVYSHQLVTTMSIRYNFYIYVYSSSLLDSNDIHLIIFISSLSVNIYVVWDKSSIATFMLFSVYSTNSFPQSSWRYRRTSWKFRRYIINKTEKCLIKHEVKREKKNFFIFKLSRKSIADFFLNDPILCQGCYKTKAIKLIIEANPPIKEQWH